MLWLVSLRVEDSICTEEGSKRPVIPAQNKSVKWFLWNVTFHRLETMPLVAQEQWGEEL